MATISIIDAASGNAIPLPGQVSTTNALLFQILVHLRAQTQLLLSINGGDTVRDDIQTLLSDAASDPTLVKTVQ